MILEVIPPFNLQRYTLLPNINKIVIPVQFVCLFRELFISPHLFIYIQNDQ